MTEVVDLWGMTYKAFEIHHDAGWEMDRIFREIARHIENSGIRGVISNVSSASSQWDDDIFVTTVIYSAY